MSVFVKYVFLATVLVKFLKFWALMDMSDFNLTGMNTKEDRVFLRRKTYW